MEVICRIARDTVRDGRPGVLAVILQSSGSTPRDRGSVMLILPEGSEGSVGGGPLEWAAMQRARELLAGGGASQEMVFDLAGTDTARSSAICGGAVRVWLHVLGQEDLPALERFCELLSRRRGADFALARRDGTSRLLCLTPGEDTDEELICRESIPVRPRLWLMGGGHVALATAKVAAVAEFDVAVADDRAEYANEERFPGAACIVCERYDGIPVSDVAPGDYIVIVTRGHIHDREALQWALGTEACYVGMIGSLRKRNMIYEALRAKGISQERLDAVHAPIGLPIGGHTPGDIAVSIVAEMVAVRAGMRGETTPHGKK